MFIALRAFHYVGVDGVAYDMKSCEERPGIDPSLAARDPRKL